MVITDHGPTAIVVELGQEALGDGDGPPEVREPDELGLMVILVITVRMVMTIMMTMAWKYDKQEHDHDKT